MLSTFNLNLSFYIKELTQTDIYKKVDYIFFRSKLN